MIYYNVSTYECVGGESVGSDGRRVVRMGFRPSSPEAKSEADYPRTLK